MSTISDKVLENLKCSLCNGYLSCSPVVVNNKNQQICAKCFKILPQNEKNQCLRQISYETLASTMVFPCRYHKMGCDFTSSWNTCDSHESECSKRYFTFPDIVNIHKENTHKQITVDVHYDNIDNNNNGYQSGSYSILENKAGKNNPNYASTTTMLTNISEEPLLPEKKVPTYENFYETLPTLARETYERCSNCQTIIKNSEVYHCLFGHVTCKKCKGEMCLVCFKNHEGTSRKCCKNVARGCSVKLLDVDVAYHRDNCEYNLLPCPIETCDKKDVLDNLKTHVKEHHNDDVYEKNELSITLNKQDKIFVFLIYDSVFKCAYYYYATYIEIFVIYLGPCEKARKYIFEVSVLTNSKLNKKIREVANWNNSMLASGVNFDKKELLNGEKKFAFTINLKILHTK